MRKVMWMWLDDAHLPRAHGAGPLALEERVKQIAHEHLLAYIEEKRRLGYRVSERDFEPLRVEFTEVQE